MLYGHNALGVAVTVGLCCDHSHYHGNRIFSDWWISHVPLQLNEDDASGRELAIWRVKSMHLCLMFCSYNPIPVYYMLVFVVYLLVLNG